MVKFANFIEAYNQDKAAYLQEEVARLRKEKGINQESAAKLANENWLKKTNPKSMASYVSPLEARLHTGSMTDALSASDEKIQNYRQQNQPKTMTSGQYILRKAGAGATATLAGAESMARGAAANAVLHHGGGLQAEDTLSTTEAMLAQLRENAPYAAQSINAELINPGISDISPVRRTPNEAMREQATKIAAGNWIADKTKLDEKQAVLAQEAGAHSKAVQFAGDMAEAIGGMLPTLAAGAANPALGMSVLGASAGGSKVREVVNNGGSVEQAVEAGILTGAKEVAIESLFDGLGGLLGKSALSGTVGKALDKAFGTKATLRYAANALGEGAEEVMAAFVQPYLDRMTWDSEAQRASMKDLLNAGAMGTVVSLIFGVPVLFQNGRMQTAESNLSGQAKADSDAFVQQVFDLFNGERVENGPLIVGDTPEILQRHGADSRKIVISPDTVRKSVYPQGYMGLKQGHNLGFGFVGKLNEQLADPVAILKSATQPNSLVVFTEMLDGKGHPVMVALHLDKNGRLGISNEIASAYGKDDFNNFIAKERAAGNVLYENKNKSLRDLPEQGYRLEEMGSQYDPMLQRQKQNSPADPRQPGVQFPGSSIDEAVSMDSPNGLWHAGVQFPGSSASEAVATTNIANDFAVVNQGNSENFQALTGNLDADTARGIEKNLTTLPGEKSSVVEKAKDFAADTYRNFVDSGFSVTQLDKALGSNTLYNYYNNARQASARAEYAINNSQTDLSGRMIGKGLNAIFKPIMERGERYTQAFYDYLRHYHNIDRMAQNKPVFGYGEEGYTAAQSADIVRRYELLYPDFRAAAEEVWGYNRNLVEIMRESGMIDAETAATLLTTYPHYVPTNRNIEQVQGKGGKSSAGGLLKTASGGRAEMLPVYEMMAEQTRRVMKQGTRNLFGRQLLKTAIANSDNPQVAKRVQLAGEQAQAAAGAAGMNLDTLLENDSQSEANNASPSAARMFDAESGRFTVYENGQAIGLQLDSGMAEAMRGLDSSRYPALVKGLGKVNNAYKSLLTSKNPAFIVTNALRDSQGGVLINSRDIKAYAAQMGPALAEIQNNGEIWQEYLALGATDSSFFNQAVEGLSFDKQGNLKLEGNAAQHLLDKIEKLNLLVEQIPRFTEYMAVRSKGDGSYDSLMEAMHAAADVTTNFSRGGKWGKAINQFVPFFNASLQGADKTIRVLKNTKGAKQWTKLVLISTLTGILPNVINNLLYADNDEWQEIDEYYKANYWLFPLGDGKWARIPKGRPQAFLAGVTDTVMAAAAGEKVGWGDIVDLAELATQNIAPNNPVTDNIFSPIDRITTGPGYDWRGNPVESTSDENLLPQDRYDSGTSEIAKTLGRVFHVSPKKVDELISSYGGFWGDVAISASNLRADGNILGGKFTVDTTYSNTLSGDFYEALETYQQTKRSPSVDSEKQAQSGIVYKYFNHAAGEISDINKQIEEIQADASLDSKEKSTQVKALKQQINQLQRDTLNKEEAYVQAAAAAWQEAASISDTEERQAVAYREANRAVFGAEYALQVDLSTKQFERAAEAVEMGVSWDDYYEVRYTDSSSDYKQAPTGGVFDSGVSYYYQDDSGAYIKLTEGRDYSAGSSIYSYQQNSGNTVYSSLSLSSSAKTAKAIYALDLPYSAENIMLEQFGVGKTLQAAAKAARSTGADIAQMLDAAVAVYNTQPADGQKKSEAQSAVLFNMSGLTAKQKEALSDAIINDDVYLRRQTDIDYSSNANRLLSLLSDSQQRKYARFSSSWGNYPALDVEAYSNLVEAYNQGSNKDERIWSIYALVKKSPEKYGLPENAADVTCVVFAQQFRRLFAKTE